MKSVIAMLATVACQSGAEPAMKVRPRDAGQPDAKLVDAKPAETAAPPHAPTLASWSSKPAGLASPACITGGNDRFIQYADVDEPGAVRFCLWWNLRYEVVSHGCWRVDLATGAYANQTGVWFSAPVPARVGIGGGAAGSTSRLALVARWLDDGVEVCRANTCKRVVLAKPQDPAEIIFDAAGDLAVVPLGGDAKAHSFATLDVAKGTRLASFAIASHHEGAEAVGFIGSSLAVTDCDAKATTCTWELYDPHTGTRIAAVGGTSPLGVGGTAVALDEQRFAAVASTHLVVQEATGVVTARLELPPTKLRADYVVFATGGGLVVPGPDGRVVLVDPATGTITRTITPPACKR